MIKMEDIRLGDIVFYWKTVVHYGELPIYSQVIEKRGIEVCIQTEEDKKYWISPEALFFEKGNEELLRQYNKIRPSWFIILERSENLYTKIFKRMRESAKERGDETTVKRIGSDEEIDEFVEEFIRIEREIKLT